MRFLTISAVAHRKEAPASSPALTRLLVESLFLLISCLRSFQKKSAPRWQSMRRMCIGSGLQISTCAKHRRIRLKLADKGSLQRAPSPLQTPNRSKQANITKMTKRSPQARRLSIQIKSTRQFLWAIESSCTRNSSLRTTCRMSRAARTCPWLTISPETASLSTLEKS